MKKILLIIAITTFLAFTTQAALIAHWGFDSYTGSTTVLPNDGPQAATATFTIAGPATLAAGTGTILNDPRIPANASVSLNTSAGTGQNTTTFTIHVNGGNLSGFIVSFAANKGTEGARKHTWAYSTDNVNFKDWVISTQSTFSGYSVLQANFTGVTAINGAQNVYLRDTITEATGTTSTTDFDNFQLNATVAIPEPVNVALGLFGLGFAGVILGRRLVKFVRR